VIYAEGSHHQGTCENVARSTARREGARTLDTGSIRLSDDETGSPLERLQKVNDTEGCAETADLLKRIYAAGSRQLDLTKVQRAGSNFDTCRVAVPCDFQLTKRVSRNQQLAALIAKSVARTHDSVEAIRAAHLVGPRKCQW
jgi:hypothetical protein